jgi:MFS family permease
VYAAVQDIIEPGLRGTAMALYFCAMYLLGASLGPIATGWASDHFARQAALERQTATPAVTASADTQGQPPPASMPAAVGELDAEAKAVGLYRAMYLIPWLGCGLVLVLFAASRTVKGDHDKLQKWMAVTHSTCTSMAEKCS